MARDIDRLAGSFETETTDGLLSGFLAEEEQFDRRALWRLGSWGVASVAAVTVAVLANHSSIGWRRDQVASTDLARQSQQVQSIARESQNETRRLASAIDTLNGDRDRLYSRVTVLEQGLDSVTGSIARQRAAVAPAPPALLAPSTAPEPKPVSQNPIPAPAVVPPVTTAAAAAEKPSAVADPGPGPATTVASAAQGTPNTPAASPATPLMASKSMMDPPDPAAGKLIEPAPNAVAAAAAPAMIASVPPLVDADPDDADATTPAVAVQRTEFAVEIGGANSVAGLRALWRGLLKSRSNAPLAALQPIIVVKESGNGLGMQLRLAAGPLSDAAAAAKICAAMMERKRPCETTVFDGQRLAMSTDEPPASAKSAAPKSSSFKPASTKPASARSAARRRSIAKPVTNDEPPKPEPKTLSSFFSRRSPE